MDEVRSRLVIPVGQGSSFPSIDLTKSNQLFSDNSFLFAASLLENHPITSLKSNLIELGLNP